LVVAQRYRSCSRFTRHYVRAKLARDPVHRDILALAAEEKFGRVVDVGCGRGQLSVALLQAGLADAALGLDCNVDRLVEAARAGAGLNFATRAQDFVVDPSIPEADTVLLVDVLYQLAPAAQAALLDSAAHAATSRILIRTLDPERGARSWITRGVERLFRRVLPNSGALVQPQPVAWLREVLEERGFAVAVVPCWRGTVLANVLLVARRSGMVGSS